MFGVAGQGCARKYVVVVISKKYYIDNGVHQNSVANVLTTNPSLKSSNLLSYY